jgi:hypothetical protein
MGKINVSYVVLKGGLTEGPVRQTAIRLTCETSDARSQLPMACSARPSMPHLRLNTGQGGSAMRWFILSIVLLTHSSFAQVTIQGTVTASYDQTVPIIDASVQFFRLDISGRDTARSVLGTVRTDQNGRFSYLLVTNVEETKRNVPKQFTLSENYPNPFQTKTQIGLDVPKPDNFTIAVYNILGQEVARLEEVLSGGSYSIQWDGSVIPGVYFVVVKASGEMKFIKLIQLQKNSGPSALRITGVSSPLQVKVTGSQSIASTSSVQVTVSKPLWQTYAGTPLTYSSQSLDVSLSYVGSGAVSASKRDSAFTQTTSQFKSLTGSLPKPEAAKAMADWLRKQPQFEDADAADDGNVWCRFTDGTIAVFVNNFEIGDTATLHRSVLAQSPRYKLNDAPPTDIPGSNMIVASGAFGALFGLTEFAVVDLARLAGYDYTLLSSQSSVPGLKTGVQNASIFFAFGHGGYGKVPTGGSEFAIWTDTYQNGRLDSVYADDLREHRLVWMYGVEDRGFSAWKYAFTGQFVRKYMTFGKNSLVYIAGCSSATNNAFVNAFFVKGASVFAGYTATWYADYLRQSALVFFDRTIGANHLSDNKETPPQRAFDWQSVLSWMQSKQYDYGSADGSSRLILVYKTGTLGPLAPSIVTMFVHPYDQKLYIYGMFGENPGSDGKVTVMGTPMQILEWGYDGQSQMDRIICKIPDDGAGSYGDVQVTVRKITSNITQLSRYKGDFTLIHETTDGRQYEVKLTLQFRVDLLGFRMKPGEKPMFNQTSYVVNADMGSKGECTASGSTGGAITWSGHTTDLHNNIDGAASSKSFAAGAWFDPEQMKMQLFMSGGIENGIIQTAGSISMPMSLIFGSDEFDGKRANFPSYVEIPLQSDFSIAKSSASAKKVGMYFSVLTPFADKVRIEWGNIKCDAPPKEEAAR